VRRRAYTTNNWGRPSSILIARSYAPFATITGSFDQIPHAPPMRSILWASAPYELSWPANPCWLYVKALRTEDINYGNAIVIHKSARLTRMVGIGANASETSAPEDLLRERRGATDEEFELIEMRYQQALALMNLEDLFAEGQLDCM